MNTSNRARKSVGGQNLVIQAGLAGNIQMNHCDMLFNGMVRLLSKLEILVGEIPLEGADPYQSDLLARIQSAVDVPDGADTI